MGVLRFGAWHVGVCEAAVSDIWVGLWFRFRGKLAPPDIFDTLAEFQGFNNKQDSSEDGEPGADDSNIESPVKDHFRVGGDDDTVWIFQRECVPCALTIHAGDQEKQDCDHLRNCCNTRGRYVS